MATMRQVDTKFWSDTWVRKLNALDRYAFLYFLTNKHSSWCGAYELDISMAAFESGIDERDLINSILPKLSPKILYLDGWVYIHNFEKYHQNGSPQTKKGIELAWKNVPDLVKAQIKEITSELIPPGGGMVGVSSSSSSFSSSSKDALAFASLPVEDLKSNTADKPKTYKEFRDARREEIGRPPMTPRKPTEKQAEVRDAFKAIDYFKQKGQTDHGMMFLEVSSEKRNAIVRKLVIAAQKTNGDLTPLIDWWFGGEGEWAAYEPEQCFSAKTVERFKNTKNLISKKAKRNFWE